ncbi:MAG: hypothetical protein QXQ95_07170, partial [Thermofilum sp.]
MKKSTRPSNRTARENSYCRGFAYKRSFAMSLLVIIPTIFISSSTSTAGKPLPSILATLLTFVEQDTIGNGSDITSAAVSIDARAFSRINALKTSSSKTVPKFSDPSSSSTGNWLNPFSHISLATSNRDAEGKTYTTG